jgi:hypothetical protein
LEFQRVLPVFRVLIQFVVVQNDARSFSNQMTCNKNRRKKTNEIKEMDELTLMTF